MPDGVEVAKATLIGTDAALSLFVASAPLLSSERWLRSLLFFARAYQSSATLSLVGCTRSRLHARGSASSRR